MDVLNIENQKSVIEKSVELVDSAKIAYLGSVDSDSFPNIKAMLNLKHDELKKIWFSTNTSSRRVATFKKNHKACVYYSDTQKFMGLMLIGTIEVLQDEESKKMLWSDGFNIYYPKGVNDPDYSVLCFTPERGNFYHQLDNVDFDLK